MGLPEHGSVVPTDLFDEHFLIDNQTSPVRRLNRRGAPRVREGLYVRIKRHEESRSSTVAQPELESPHARSGDVVPRI